MYYKLKYSTFLKNNFLFKIIFYFKILKECFKTLVALNSGANIL